MFLKRVLLPLDFRAFQLVYATLISWWGIAPMLGLSFSLDFLDYMRKPAFCIGMILIGVFGFISGLCRIYMTSYIFHVMGVFLFSSVAFSFFKYDPNSAAGITYSIETLIFIWLTLRLKSFPFQEKIV